MTQHLEHDDILGEHDIDKISGHKVQSFKEELREMPLMLRWTIYLCLVCSVLLCLQCVFIMPLILSKYGWGYGGAFIH